PCLGEDLVPTPDWHRDDLRAPSRQAPSRIGICDVITRNNAEPSKVGLKNGIVVARSQLLHFLAGQIHLAILSGKIAMAVQKHGRVVDNVTFALIQAGNHISLMLSGEFTQPSCGWAWNGFGNVGVAL